MLSNYDRLMRNASSNCWWSSLSTVQLGLNLITQIEIASGMQYVSTEYSDLENTDRRCNWKRAEIKSADFRIKAGQAGVTIAESSWYPQISLIGDYYYSKPNQRIFPSRNQFWCNMGCRGKCKHQRMELAHYRSSTEAGSGHSYLKVLMQLSIIKDGITLEVLKFSEL